MSSPDSINLKNKVGIFIFGTIWKSCDPKNSELICYSDFYVRSFNMTCLNIIRIRNREDIRETK